MTETKIYQGFDPASKNGDKAMHVIACYPDDGKKRVVFTREELEEITDYFFDLGVNGHIRQRLDKDNPRDFTKAWDEDLRETKMNEIFGVEKAE